MPEVPASELRPGDVLVLTGRQGFRWTERVLNLEPVDEPGIDVRIWTNDCNTPMSSPGDRVFTVSSRRDAE